MDESKLSSIKEEGRQKFPRLAKIMDRILAMPSSSAASERCWSIFRVLLPDNRNKMKPETLDKLAFIYMNGRLLDKEAKLFEASLEVFNDTD